MFRQRRLGLVVLLGNKYFFYIFAVFIKNNKFIKSCGLQTCFDPAIKSLTRCLRVLTIFASTSLPYLFLKKARAAIVLRTLISHGTLAYWVLSTGCVIACGQRPLVRSECLNLLCKLHKSLSGLPLRCLESVRY